MSLWPARGVQQVAYEAHICGMAFGFVTVLLLLVSGLLQRDGEDLLAVLRRRAVGH
jgi:hypothetical protein